MTIIFTKLTEIRESIYRNIVGIDIGFDEFDDLTSDISTKQYAHRMVQSSNKLDAQYQAIDYLFNLTSWEPSRFGTGLYPVWYASRDLMTSFYETLPHYKKTYLNNPAFKTIPSTISSLRTVFSVQCEAALIDLRNDAKKHPELISTDSSNYRLTQEIGKRIYREGYPGLLAKSARIEEGEAIAVFKKNILINAQLFQHYIYEYDLINNKTYVKTIDNAEIILEQ